MFCFCIIPAGKLSVMLDLQQCHLGLFSVYRIYLQDKAESDQRNAGQKNNRIVR